MKRLALSLLVLLGTGSLFAQTLTRETTPEPLRPWIDWSLYGHETQRCPFFQGEKERRQCAWPSRLSLDLTDQAGRFSQEWLAYVEEWVGLPGDSTTWPLDVRLDGKSAPVIARAGLPSVRILKGRHTVSGIFA